MKLEKKISRACKQAALLGYVRNDLMRLVPVPAGQRPLAEKAIQLTLHQN
ncbi:MAG: hypothetical protein ACRYG7_10330 [Janthinobacterium lividum]